MPPAETPDFDSMSPEEVMAWMESLAKRQGAIEGFTTDANMEIAEIDPSTVEIDEPGYVPFGEETRKPAAPKAEKPPAAAPLPPAPVKEPVIEAEPEPEPVTEINLLDEPPISDEDTVIEIEEGSLAWLESLAADQTSGFPQMDLEALSAEIAELPEEPEVAEPVRTNPMDWLESLADGEAEELLAEPEMELNFEEEAEEPEVQMESDLDLASITDPMAAGIDPMLWLESLAKRQGARSEELTTSADMNIPIPENMIDTGPGYHEYSVEDESRAERAADRSAEQTMDPAAWLESMATASAVPGEVEDATMSDDQIRAALAQGEEIPSDQMEKFFERQLDRGMAGSDTPPFEIEEYDPDAPPIPAELPDWLLEQVQPPEEVAEAAAEEAPESEDRQPVLLDEIVEPPAADLPDWLRVDESQEADLELESIFESAEDVGGPEEEVEFLTTDPWVRAFAEEAQSDPDAIPEWYEQNLRDPARIAAVERQIGGEVDESLEAAPLPPETELTEGEPQPVPAWAAAEVPATDEAEPLEEIPDWLSEAQPDEAVGEIPDWLAAADVEVAPDEIPAWLRDTVETDELIEEEAISTPELVRPEPVVAQAAPPPPPAPAPAPLPAPAADVAATLDSARSKASEGDLDGCLVEYESIVRANAALDHVVGDLTRLVEQHKDNPAVYRVLGDGLMRQGNLQAALDTYRKALNQL